MFSFLEATSHLGIAPKLPNPHCYISGASIDTRTLEPGELFVALEGLHVDGHDYLESAFRKGAAGAIISKKYYDKHGSELEASNQLYQNLIVSENPEKTFADMSLWLRMQCDAICIGITGSVGKTSTKDFLYYLLKTKYPVLATRGNFNNHLGLPLTLMRLQSSDRFCIAEMGANKANDIKALSEILKPNCAIITGIAPTHLKGFGTLEAIYETKLDLFRALKPGSLAVIPYQDRVLLSKVRELDLDVVTVGFSDDADYSISDLEIKENRVSFKVNQDHSFSFPGIASFLALNATLALAIVDRLGNKLETIPTYWEGLRVSPGRFEVKEIPDQNIKLIDDGYNASPESFKKALQTLSDLEVEGRKLIVFSDMLELGEASETFHQALGELIARYDFDFVASYGDFAKIASRRCSESNPCMAVHHFEEIKDLVQSLHEKIQPGDVVLFKGSRGMKVEQVLNLVSESIQKTSNKV